MCGICGILQTSGSAKFPLGATVEKMAQRIRHRGPDAGNVWADENAGIALGHRRLSIIDLSEAGSQPIHSDNGRWILTYNGELYNTDSLRKNLENGGSKFKGHSDTEVLVEAIATWGLQRTLDLIEGMFAFAIWDRQERKLYLVRDRIGIKPLYWGKIGERVIFGSELNALRAVEGFEPEIDVAAAAAFFRFNCVPAPFSIYKGIEKLFPGQFISIDSQGQIERGLYWNLREIARESIKKPYEVSDQNAIDGLETLMRDSIRRHMVSDVPLGSFLSGGIDSSLVTALMQAESSHQVKSFSIGFNELSYNEADHAKEVAHHLKTDHTELYFDPSMALDIVPSIAQIYDEPFADSSQLPTYILSKLTREHVTVALSGDGGDEIFAGYNRYLWYHKIQKVTTCLPRLLRTGIAQGLTVLSPSTLDRLTALLPKRLPHFGDKVHKLAAILPLEGDEIYRALVSHWQGLVLGNEKQEGVFWDQDLSSDFPDNISRMQFLDSATYLPNDILTKVDRASMAVSLEVRVPILDHTIIEHAWHLPNRMKLRGSTGKWILREILYKHVPKQLINRPKMGFGVPIGEWMKGPIRDWVEDLLSEQKLSTHGLLNSGAIRQKWVEHLGGSRNWQYHLWDVLMFQSWWEGVFKQNSE